MVQTLLFGNVRLTNPSQLRGGTSYVIAYEDGNGNETIREIRILDDLDPIYVWAHCRLRRAERCFRRDRIRVIGFPGDGRTLSDWVREQR